MDKETFIKMISNLDREQINELIQKKGKKAKKIKLFSTVKR